MNDLKPVPHINCEGEYRLSYTFERKREIHGRTGTQQVWVCTKCKDKQYRTRNGLLILNRVDE